MQSALRVTTTVRPGGKIEVTDPQLPSGQSVDVIVLIPQFSATASRSVVEILAEAPGQVLFQTPEDVEAYLREERDAWDR